MLAPTFFSKQLISTPNVKEHQWYSRILQVAQKMFLIFGVMSQLSFSSSLALMRSVQCWIAVWCEHHLLHIGGAHPLLGLVGSVFKRHFGIPGIGLKGWKFWNTVLSFKGIYPNQYQRLLNGLSFGYLGMPDTFRICQTMHQFKSLSVIFLCQFVFNSKTLRLPWKQRASYQLSSRKMSKFRPCKRIYEHCKGLWALMSMVWWLRPAFCNRFDFDVLTIVCMLPSRLFLPTANCSCIIFQSGLFCHVYLLKQVAHDMFFAVLWYHVARPQWIGWRRKT